MATMMESQADAASSSANVGTQPQVTVFYDGLCPLCSREINHYRKVVRDGSIGYVDISEPTFDAAAFGLDPVQVHRHLHVVDASGKVFKGVDSFLKLWPHVPGMRWLAPLVGTWGIRHLAKLGYAVFARIRPLLPKRKRDNCDTGTCER
ncbi:thiol-disulfide oxidoreductase DCC family protein [Tuwongella immobilis]|uniref:DUF393 domain-containing protein n=1 Tax=Tuwongella immobilis TaxID=692036 RepID=A0A6C2YU57_9BACT|nr:DUF393 domain-containing protein [Tuwongella immobilis]VIP04412.1 Uncharacterized protein OS=Bdellovibrio bacteriovorus GN=EP01_14660 PE=4 SV=1: DUF393 [Tuwongella immobilis]VTS06186.1 Uncharacterized protein OS=Bdellovibrio bacteriovorus GN=EP01_14660 PE=4 SV=1: DUF393 [Tuwongella immobilis]